MRNVEIIIPTLGHKHFAKCMTYLRFLPWPVKIHVVTEGSTWAKAINIGLREVSAESDVILMDDDVFLKPDTFDLLPQFYDKADIFGFKLLFPNNRIQHAGGVLTPDGFVTHLHYGKTPEAADAPSYVCHATTSLVYVKAGVLQRLGGMAEDIPGVQMEDVDFSFRALKAGMRILFLPGEAVHMESATKKTLTKDFEGRIAEAFGEIKRRHLSDPEFIALAGSYPKPAKEEVHA